MFLSLLLLAILQTRVGEMHGYPLMGGAAGGFGGAQNFGRGFIVPIVPSIQISSFALKKVFLWMFWGTMVCFGGGFGGGGGDDDQ